MANAQGFGQLDTDDFTSEFNAIQFIINQTLLRVRTIVLVQVMSTTNSGAAVPPGTVSVQLLNNMLDGQGNSTPHGTIFNIPVFRYGSGNGCIICDPVVGDTGLMAVADRDISAVQSVAQATPGVSGTAALANPASYRTFDLADGVYLGSLFGKAPTQGVAFQSTGLTIFDMNGNKLISSSSGWAFTGNVSWQGNFTATGDITAGFGTADSVTLQNHLHAGVTAGGASSSKPTAGT